MLCLVIRISQIHIDRVFSELVPVSSMNNKFIAHNLGELLNCWWIRFKLDINRGALWVLEDWQQVFKGIIES